MTKLLLSAAAVLLLLLPVRADNDAGPLTVTPSSDWSVKYQKHADTESYLLQPPPGQIVDFAFSRWPAPGNGDQIPGYLDTLAKGFVEAASHNPKVKLDSAAYTQGEFIGDPYSGKYVQFTLKNGQKDILYIFGDNTGLWYGHYIGTADGWLDAMEVLKGIKKT